MTTHNNAEATGWLADWFSRMDMDVDELEWPQFTSMSDLHSYIADTFGIGDAEADRVVEFVMDELLDADCAWPHRPACVIPLLVQHEETILDLILEVQQREA